ncbi:MAG TPA: NAD+ synthase [Cellulomonas sp.]
MPDHPLRIALAQIDTCVGDVAGNAAAVVAWARRAADAGAALVAFPEMTVTGYPIEDLALRASFRRGAERALTDLAAELEAAGLGDLTVVVGSVGERTVREHDGAPARPTNQGVVLHHGAVQQRYDKRHLPNYGVFDEFRIFTPGAEPCVIEVDGHRVGLVICEDIWQDGPVEALVGQGVDLVLVINGSPYEEGKGHQRVELAARRSAQVGAPVAYVNMVGGQDDLVFDGGSFVVLGSPTTAGSDGAGADGHDVGATLLATAPQFVEQLLLWDLPATGRPLARGPVAAPLDPDEEVYRALVVGLAGYVRKNGFRSVVLGMSGGIDSALVAAIAADAVGGECVVGVSMPSRWSSDHSRDDAADLARRIGADYRVQPIKPMVDAFEGEMALDGVAAENLQARVRGVILMALSNAEGHLVLATGNKTELAVGYSTIYGDAVGGYAPLKDVDKSRVWALSRWRNQHALDDGQIPPIPESSITKPPSAELRPGQVDQDSLPPYDLLDEVLDAYVEHAEGRAELLARGYDTTVVDRVLSLVDRAEWKRRQYPLGPKVTALAFGRDRRLPITTRWREPVDVPAAAEAEALATGTIPDPVEQS